MFCVKYRFEWDLKKACGNEEKHGVSFEEAAIFDDEFHSTEEIRDLIIGHSLTSRLLVASFTERPNGVIRLISARTATKRECRDYEKNWKSE